MELTWKKIIGVESGGDVGGDYQITEAREVRFICEQDPRLMITSYFYGEVPGDRQRAYDEDDVQYLDPVVITRQDEVLLGRDVNDRTGTEQRADAWYSVVMRNVPQGEALEVITGLCHLANPPVEALAQIKPEEWL